MASLVAGAVNAAYLDIPPFMGRQAYRPTDPEAQYVVHQLAVQSVSGPYMIGFISKEAGPITSSTYKGTLVTPRESLGQNASQYRRAVSTTGASLRYALYQSHDSPVPLTDGVSSVERSSLITGLDASLEKRHILYVSALPGQWVPPGLYQDIVTVEVLSGFFEDRAMATRLLERPWPVVIPVGAITYARAVTPTVLSFNPLQNTVFSGRVQYKIGANVPMVITVSSQNGDRLVDTQSELRIPYHMTHQVSTQDVTLFFKLGMNPSKHDIQGQAIDTVVVTMTEL